MLRSLAALVLFIGGPALAQADVIFGSGKPPAFREEEFDRRFNKSRLNRGILKGTDDPHCLKLFGGLLTAVAEIGPTLHKRDQDFYVDPYLLQGVNAQLSSQRFPAQLFLTAMVRRVLIDRKLPKEWLELGAKLAAVVPQIDVGKLRYLADGLQPVDSFEFTLPMLRQRYELEVNRATTAARPGADEAFRSAYLDRDVAWSELVLTDLVPEKSRKEGEGPPTMIAHLEWRQQAQQGELNHHDPMSMLRPTKPRVLVKVKAQLAATQYLDVTKLPKGKRLLVKGRLWGIEKGVSEVELREALLFEDRDWSKGVPFDPTAAARCPMAINDLTGVASRQPGGFAH